MKYLYILFVSITIMFFSCKKDTGPTNDNFDTEYYKKYNIITSHYWRLSEKWQDTTDYGKNNPHLVPLASSQIVNFFTDSCQYYTCSKFATDSWYYVVKKPGCSGCNGTSPCEFKDQGKWSLSPGGKFFIGPYGTTQITTLNDSTFIRFSYLTYNFTKKLVEVYVYKAYVYH